MSQKIVVVGAGSAGCVVAARLSEDATNEVVLLEGGPDYPDLSQAPDDIQYAHVTGGLDHDWGYSASRGSGPDDAERNAMSPILAMRGKVVGGSSSVNGTSILRALPSDFERWTEAGNDAWSWDQVLPAFRDLEDDDIGGEWHGVGGPLPIRRFQRDAMLPVHKAYVAACENLGHKPLTDLNGPDVLGCGPLPMNQVDGIRQSAAVTHLDAARARPNLKIRSGVMVDRLELVDGKPTAVVLADGERIDCDQVVLSAGAYNSPAILMRSGVGPATELKALGIDPVLDVPAMGKNLMEHPVFVISAAANLDKLGELRPPIQSILSMASDGSTDSSHMDVQVVLMVKASTTSDWFAASLGTLLFGVALGKPSGCGQVQLASADAQAAPEIWLDFYPDSKDLDKMIYGVDMVRKVMATEPLAGFIEAEEFPGPDVDGEALRSMIRDTSPSGAHAVGTCRMGPADTDAVVDQTGRVHGLRDVWVIDSSIIPHVPSVPTNEVTMMVAERCVSWMRGKSPMPASSAG